MSAGAGVAFSLGLAVVIIIVVLAVVVPKIAAERFEVRDGVLTRHRGDAGIPLHDASTVVIVSKSSNFWRGRTAGFFNTGGLVILDAGGHLLGVLRRWNADSPTLRAIAAEIPAGEQVDFTDRSRADFVRSYPRALGFWKLRDSAFWAIFGIVLFFVVVIVVIVGSVLAIGLS